MRCAVLFLDVELNIKFIFFFELNFLFYLHSIPRGEKNSDRPSPYGLVRSAVPILGNRNHLICNNFDELSELCGSANCTFPPTHSDKDLLSLPVTRLSSHFKQHLTKMSDQRSCKRKDIVKHLVQKGWCSVYFKGSHEHFVHAKRAGKIQVNRTKTGWLKRGTAASIYKRAS